MYPSINEQMDVIKQGVIGLYNENELVEKLEKSILYNTPLIIKVGCDPNKPDLHLGHSVVLGKLREFQDLGHQAILIVGDFTGMIGDPSGRNSQRPSLTLQETRENGKSYFQQASKLLDPVKTRIVYNSDWLSCMQFEDIIRLASRYTIDRMLEQFEFNARCKKGESISVHELLYPLAQAMDSVAIRADVEVGGIDQTFNMHVCRDIQAQYGQQPQICITMPLLRGVDGENKMSKYIGNYISINDLPLQMFAKIVAIPDHVVAEYFELTTQISRDELQEIKTSIDQNSADFLLLKFKLARILVTRYYTAHDAMQAEQQVKNNA